jgi:urease accessory protein
MLLVREILGAADRAALAGRRVERLPVASTEAAKPRLRRTTDAGTDVALDLPRGSYLRHDALLVDDGRRAIVVERAEEEALIVRLAPELPVAELLRQATALGHAFGNQHVPIEVDDYDVRIPVTTSRDVVLETVRQLDLTGSDIVFAHVRLGCDRPLHYLGHAHA